MRPLPLARAHRSTPGGAGAASPPAPMRPMYIAKLAPTAGEMTWAVVVLTLQAGRGGGGVLLACGRGRCGRQPAAATKPSPLPDILAGP